MRRPDTLRGQLVLLAMAPMAFVLLVSAGATYAIAYRVAQQAYDYSLLDETRTIATRISVSADAPPSVNLSPGVREVLSYDPMDRVYFEVSSARYGLLAGRGDLPVASHAGSEGTYYDGSIDGTPVRLMMLPVTGDVRVIVAETLNKRESLTRRIVLAVLVTEVALIVVGGLLVWIGIGRGMAPVQRIVQIVALRGHHDLSPIAEEPAAAELRSLVHSVNDLLARLDLSLSMQHRFIADAAHQLRTPIAGLLAQIETALAGDLPQTTRERLEQLRISSRRTARLVNQLLALARAAPGQQQQMDFRPVDLTALVRKLSREWVPEALRSCIDLGYEGTSDVRMIEANAPLVEDMVANLVENAIRYTARGGAIDVRLENCGPSIVLEVVNDGAPIPESERERIFERFYRIPGSAATGSGLGLAIVRDVARMHGATVEVRIERGRNCFRVTFPNSGAESEN